MLLIAPDKYRGTLTAIEAARIIASNIKNRESLLLPMADGGEGTAACLASREPGWEYVREGVYVNRLTATAAVDTSAVVGYSPDFLAVPPRERSTAPLGNILNELMRNFTLHKIYVGVGGTSTCDAGIGMLQTLDNRVSWHNILVGLIDVRVPLLPSLSEAPSALMFCRQKGIVTPADMEFARERLEKAVRVYGPALSPFAGAGGGLGYALADVIGAPCHGGAEFLLASARIPWSEVDAVLTGEGRYDSQTQQGKVVSVLYEHARRYNLPVVCLAGCVEAEAMVPEGMTLVDTSRYFPELELNSTTAALRLAEAARDIDI